MAEWHRRRVRLGGVVSGPEWALDPWSDEPRWIAVESGRLFYKIPRPCYLRDHFDRVERLTVADVYRHRYFSPYVGEVAAYGEPLMVAPLLRLAEVAIGLMVAIKRLVPE